MHILLKSGWFFALVLVAGCSSGGDDDSEDKDAGTGGSSTGDSCEEEALLTTAASYCNASEALWGEVDCEYQPCTEQNFDGLVDAVQSNGCGCELVAYYDCESARFTDEDAADCTCEGAIVVCPDEDLCAAQKTAFESCLSP
jgi:hypothetical protein